MTLSPWRPAWRHLTWLCLVLAISLTGPGMPSALAQPALPALTAPVNDFAGVIDAANSRAIEALIRSLQDASGDVVVVATVRSFKPFPDIRSFAVKLFENQGRGVGTKGKDNGLLVVLAVDDRQVWVEVGYDLESFITDGFAGETSRTAMVPEFRRGDYGGGLLAGTAQIIGRIAQGRQVTLQGVPAGRRQGRPGPASGKVLLLGLVLIFWLFNVVSSRMQGGRRGLNGQWRRGGWSGWNSGVGPFGGGGFGGGGFGGGFGGFGGGRSGGGGGGGSW